MNAIDMTYAITEAQLPAKRIIITEDFPRYPVPAIKAGAAGLLAGDTRLNELVPTIPYTCGSLAHSRSSDSLARPGYHAIQWLAGGVTM